jgi:hypothetical protein
MKNENDSGQGVPSSDLLAYTMTNAELADAISAAYDRCGTTCEWHQANVKHLKDLLAVQLGRASACVIDYANTNMTGGEPAERKL